MNVYINDIAVFLPNSPVDNEGIEKVLGEINNIPSRTKKIILRNNKIRYRYYAIDPETGNLNYNNAQLTAEAIKRLKPYHQFRLEDIESLCCGTTSPDLLMPGHALMVLGELGLPPCEAVTTSGICISGMTALKYAYMNVAAGLTHNAVASGSELSSSYMKASFFSSQTPISNEDVEKNPVNAFNAEFLRWMLSDGAGAVFLSDQKNTDQLSLKIEWIENISFAGSLETCMYAGGIKADDGRLTGWRETDLFHPLADPFIFSVKQDIKILEKEIVRTAINQALVRVINKYHLSPEDIDWYLPHYSSHYFRDKFYNAMKDIAFEIPYEKWFTNLGEKGNTGSAAIYIIMEELFHSGKLRKGEKLLCFIPESGRFSHCFMMLTVI